MQAWILSTGAPARSRGISSLKQALEENSAARAFRQRRFKTALELSGWVYRPAAIWHLIHPASGEIRVYSFEGAGLPPNTSSGVLSIQEDQDRALWLATNRLGLVKLTPDRKQAMLYQSDPDDPKELSGDLVRSPVPRS